MPPRPVPSPAAVDAIIALADPVVRNLRLTQCYYELSGAIAVRVRRDLNWCTFATWASKQAGHTIRGEDFDDMIDRALDEVLTAPHAAAVLAALQALGSTDEAAAVRRTLAG